MKGGCVSDGAVPLADSTTDSRWRMAPGLGLHRRELGERIAVFNEETADTHFLDSRAGALLARLEQGPATAAELEAVLEADQGDAPQGTAELLDEFRFLGLIELADPCS